MIFGNRVFGKSVIACLLYPVIMLAVLAACAASLPIGLHNKAVPAYADSSLQYRMQSDQAIRFTPSGHAEMEAWRRNFAARALQAGHDENVVFRTLEGIYPLALYLGSGPMGTKTEMANQAEFARPIWDYIDVIVTPARKKRGREKLRAFASLFDRIEVSYGVNREVLAAIWAIESDFGSQIGRFDAANTLANMATEGRRRALAEQELIALIKLQESGDVQRADLISGWAGAMGQAQFMPSTVLGHAVDFDEDGRKDIWTSVPDALASAANYLKASGYRKDDAWGMEVKAPAGFDWSVADGRLQTVSVWMASGLVPLADDKLSVDTDMVAQLWLPAGASGPKYLLFTNFTVYKTYNSANAYALAIGLLADHFRGKDGPVADWPTQTVLLTVAEVRLLQDRLNQLGFSAGAVDGIAGPQTRKALSRFQKVNALYPADGFPAIDALKQVLAVTD